MSKSVVNDPRLSDLPPLARLLCRQVVSATDDGNLELKFEASETLTNRFGTVQGGILSTMLDGALGMAVMITLPAGQVPVTISMSVSYFEPAKPGPIHASARVIRSGKTIAHAAADLRDDAGTLLAHGTAALCILSSGK